ncbi:MAG TPA: DUF2877 domain-containing protein [Candidatus Rifleibacterium sp.]|nr:DUF2877 domain-containing protein [Candidatus Rifleibacterium sp.]HPW58047.1 DUF2877 domain-containing protein [Candidatus Rifleibacterium sp.]
MINPDGRIEWPYFTRRCDFIIPSASPLQLQVSEVFNHGFDARCEERLFYFATEALSLHPLAFLVPASMCDLIQPETSILVAAAEILFLDINGREQRLMACEPVKVKTLPVCPDPDRLRQNLAAALTSLKLFGRNSIVLDLILGCNTEKNILSGAEAIIFAFPPDLSALFRFVGAGEGLTPAFDDFLSGMLLADRWIGANQIAVPENFASVAKKKTTVQAEQQLLFAADGRMSLRFEEFLYRLLLEDIKTKDVVKILNYGHSSGTDILCGIWHYLNNLRS